MSVACRFHDLLGIAGEVAHHEIELRKGDLSVMRKEEDRLERLCHPGSGVALGR